MKYKEWLNYWLENYVQPTAKQRTYIRYKEIVCQHIFPKLGEYSLPALTPFIMQCYITELLKAGNLKTGMGLSPNSVNSIITVLQNSLKLACSLGYMSEYFGDKIKRPKTIEKKIESFSCLEQKKLESYILNNNKDKLFGIVLCLYTGLRIGELLALEWADFDLVKLELNINKTCHDGKDANSNFARITEKPKTSSSIRVIPLPKQLLPHLKRLKKNSTSQYFISNNGNPITIRSYQRTFDLLLKKLNISHRGFHTLRHTFATRALECGMDIKTLSEILGHKNSTVTLSRYVHSFMEHKKDLMNKVGKLL